MCLSKRNPDTRENPRVHSGSIKEGRCSGALNAGAIVIRASTTLIMRLAIVLTSESTQIIEFQKGERKWKQKLN